MDTDEIFDHIAALRREHADLLEGLTDEQLATPSLCGGWDVLACLGHLAYAAKPSGPGFALAMVRHRGFDGANAALARSTALVGRDRLVAMLRANAGSRFTPPMSGAQAPLTDQLVHGMDIRQPLGIAWTPDPAAVSEGLRFLTSGKARGFVRQAWVDGLCVEADDVGFTSGGGPLVAGRGVEVAAALCGRTALLGSLTGDGVELLRERLA